MSGSKRILSSVLLGILALMGCATQTHALLPPAEAPLPNYDKRPSLNTQISTERAAAVAQLKRSVPDARADFDPLTGSARWVRSRKGFLSGPQGNGISASALSHWPPGDPHRIVKAFLEEHSNLFGHGAGALENAQVKRQFETPHNGLKTAVWEEQCDNIAVFDGLLIAHTTRNEELVSICSAFISQPARAADRGTPNRANLELRPTCSSFQAVATAAAEIGEHPGTAEVTRQQSPEGASQRQFLIAPGLNGRAQAELVWLPLSADRLRLCWEIMLVSKARGEAYRVLVDAESGEPLLRHCLTSYLSDATYRIYASDSPSPFSPGNPSPISSQPPLTARTLATLSALDTNASPNGWVNDGTNETQGNNVDAHTDWNNDDQPDLPRPQGSPFRFFDFTMDLTQQPTNYASASVTQLFYLCNWMHDELYDLGFTEAAGNFQNNNFGRGGAAGDAIQADAQDGGGVNNANFSVYYDGTSGRMQMYLFNGPAPMRDGSLDAEIVLHEYTHGLSNRRVGGGVLITALQTAGMGEGWSDFYALALLSEAGDDVNGVYACGAYATYLLSGLTQNYYFGIRRYPYCTDLTKNPLTFKDIDPVQASSHTGIPKNPVIGGPADEVHSQGEVWCVTLWDARAQLIQKYGWATGNQLVLRLVTDGMNLSPANPTFLEARDAILQADVLDNGATDLKELWTAFAKRGMGFSATSSSSYTTAGLHEAFDLPFDALEILPTSGIVSSGGVGGPFRPAAQVYRLVNTGTNPVSWAVGATVPWIGLSVSTGILTNSSSLSVTASVSPAANSLPKGNYTGALWFTNLSSGGVFNRPCKLTVGKSVVGWGGSYESETVPDSLFDVVAVTCGSYDTFALKKDGTVFAWGPNFNGQTNVPAGLSNVVAIACGTAQTLAIKADGTVTAWGGDYSGQCDVPADLANAIAVAGGYYHSLALRGDGTVICWGGDNYGQTLVPATLSNVVAIAAGHFHSVALRSDGTVVCWGANFYGQSSPPAGLANVVAIAAGGYHTMALRKDGTVAVWGDSSPANVPPGLTNVTAIAAGEEHDLALRTDGTVVAWGEDPYGETDVPLGLTNAVSIAAGWYHSAALINDGTLYAPLIYGQPLSCTIPKNNSVVFNVGAVGAPTLKYRWKKDGVDLANGKTVAGADSAALVLVNLTLADAGNYRVAVSNQNGSAVSSNASLTVLDPAILQQPVGVTNVLGDTASFNVVATGTTPLRYQWQKNGVNLTDGGNISGTSTPTLTAAAVQPTNGGNYAVVVSNRKGSQTSATATLRVITAPEIVRQPLNRTQLAGKNASFDVNVRGAAPLRYRWVKNATNYLTDGGNLSGTPSSHLSLSSVMIADQADYAVVITNTFGSVTSSPAHLKVSTARGHVVAWGDNQYGQTNVPTGLTNVMALSAGGYHSVALKSDGTVVEWGDTGFIPAGASNIIASDISANLDLVLKDDNSVGGWGLNLYGEATVPAGLSNAVAVTAGFDFSAALNADGTVMAWGNVPLQMSNALAKLTSIVAISAGDDHLLLLASDGTVLALGENFAGQTDVPAGLSNVTAIAAGGKHNLALKTDGTVVAWGADWYGQANVPTDLANVTAIGGGLGTSLAVKRDGTMVTWGQFDQGRANIPPNGLSRVAAVASGYTHSLALVNDVLPTAPQLNPSASGFIPNGGFKLVFAGDVDGTYSVWGSTNLVTWSWLGYGQPIGGGLFQFIDLPATNRSASFYRAEAP